MTSLTAVTTNVLQALESGRIGLDFLVGKIMRERTTPADAYVAYVAAATYLLEHKPENYEESAELLKRFMRDRYPSVMK